MTSSHRFGDRASRVGRVLWLVCSLAVVAACEIPPSGPQSVTVTQPRPPTADFAFSASDLDVAFTDASSDPDGSIASWSWVFGDGATDNPSETASARLRALGFSATGSTTTFTAFSVTLEGIASGTTSVGVEVLAETATRRTAGETT
jgi:hypothetical protein